MATRDDREFQLRGLPLLVAGAIAALSLVGVILMQRSQLNQPSLWVTDPRQAEQQEAVRLQLLQKAPTFGFDNVIADWVFLNFLQYYGDTPIRQQTGYSLSPKYFDLITQRDPRFVGIYLFLSGTVAYQLAQPELALQYIDRGTAALSPQIDPKAFQVWRFKGLIQLLLLGDIKGSIHSHEMAAKWAGATPDASLVPVFQDVANFLRQDPNSVPVRLQSWATIYAQAAQFQDQQTQARAKQEIEKLGWQLQVENGELRLRPLAPKASLPSVKK